MCVGILTKTTNKKYDTVRTMSISNRNIVNKNT